MTINTEHPEAVYIEEGVEKALLDTQISVSEITSDVNILIKDEYGFEAELTPLNEIRIADKHRLCGGMFGGATPDPNIYTSVLTGSSTATITDRLMTLGQV